MTPELWESICRSSLGHRSSQEQTYDIARLVLTRGIPGDFVECGVFAGASCAIMAHAIMDQRLLEAAQDRPDVVSRADISPRFVHLFDSFAGIPGLGPEDSPKQVIAGEARCPVEGVVRNMQRWRVPAGMLAYHVGDFAQTVPLWGAGPAIALLRLDGDLYRSTKVCLDYLYPLVSPGGYVIVDDYDLDGCRQAVTEYFRGAPAPMLWRKPA